MKTATFSGRAAPGQRGAPVVRAARPNLCAATFAPPPPRLALDPRVERRAQRPAGPPRSVRNLLGMTPPTSDDDSDLTPDVEQLALFADAESVATGDAAEGGWWARLWRYQGL